MTPHNLPQHWQWVRLGDIAEIIGGTTPSTTNPEYWDGECPWITPAEINNDSKIIYQTKRQITQKAVKDKSLRILPIGTILLSSRAPIGKVAIVGSEMYCNQGFKNLVCDEKKIYNLYLFYFLKGKTTFLNSLGRGTTFKEISKSIVEQIKIPLPPLEIQREIVEILESKLEKIASAKAILESSLKECETYRLSLLNDAFNGNLTPHSKTWQWVGLGEICDTSSGGTPSRSQPNYWNGEIKWLKSGELNDGLVDKVEETISQEGLKHSSAKVLPKGTLLIAMYGATIGRLGILNIQTSTNQAICAITPKESNTINTKFLFWFLFASRPKMLQDSFGGAQKNISQTYLKQFSIPLPPLEIQREIVEILESKLEKIASAKAILESSLKECETYRLSLLESAFKGELK